MPNSFLASEVRRQWRSSAATIRAQTAMLCPADLDRGRSHQPNDLRNALLCYDEKGDVYVSEMIEELKVRVGKLLEGPCIVWRRIGIRGGCLCNAANPSGMWVLQKIEEPSPNNPDKL